MSDSQGCLVTDCSHYCFVCACLVVSVDHADGQPVASAVQLGSGDKVQQVVAVPQQFHFHAHSEHLLHGKQAAIPLHLRAHSNQRGVAWAQQVTGRV